jgi:modulator of FtsH protease
MTTTSTTPAVSAPLSRDQAGGLLGQTMGLVALTAGFFALGAYIGRDTSGGWTILWYLAAFAVLFGMNAAAQRSEQLAVGLLFAFGALLGLAVAPTVGYYVGADPQAVWEAGGATALFIAGFGAAGYATDAI